MKFDQIRFHIKKLLKELKILKKDYPDWKKILEEHKDIYNELKKKSSKGQKILICTSTGGHLLSSHFEALLSLALTRYGAKVEILLCDKSLKACQMSTTQFVDEITLVKKGQKKLCNACIDSGIFAFKELGLKIHFYSDFIDKNIEDEILNKVDQLSMKEMSNYNEDGISIGEHAFAGALRYYAVGDLDKEKYGKNVLKKYLYSGILTKHIFENFLKKNKLDKVVLNHAIYVPQGIICNIAKAKNIPIIVYTNAYRKNSFIFSHNDTYHKTMIDEDTKDWENINLTKTNVFEDLNIENLLKDSDLVHIDLSNDGETVKQLLNLYEKSGSSAVLIFEGGSKERDQVPWMAAYNKTPINPVLEEYATNACAVVSIIEAFPSVSIIARSTI